jgi:hypothetical protein
MSELVNELVDELIYTKKGCSKSIDSEQPFFVC